MSAKPLPRAAPPAPAPRFFRPPAPSPPVLRGSRIAVTTGQAEAAGLAVYEKGFEALYQRRYREAADLFRQVTRMVDDPGLAERARQQGQLAEARLLEQREKRGQAAEPRRKADADPFLLAVVTKNEGRLAEALELCVRGGRQGRDERFAYLAASILALSDRPEEAMRWLAKSIELETKNRVRAHHDPDFQSLTGRAEFARLVGAARD